jgi:hypothetical protein
MVAFWSQSHLLLPFGEELRILFREPLLLAVDFYRLDHHLEPIGVGTESRKRLLDRRLSDLEDKIQGLRNRDVYLFHPYRPSILLLRVLSLLLPVFVVATSIIRTSDGKNH